MNARDTSSQHDTLFRHRGAEREGSFIQINDIVGFQKRDAAQNNVPTTMNIRYTRHVNVTGNRTSALQCNTNNVNEVDNNK